MNINELRPYFGSKERILRMFSQRQLKGVTKSERYMYVDHGAPILLVAHIDTVQTPRLDKATRGAGYDDRLGVYAAHQLCRQYPKWFDLLLSDYEEKIASTAEFFEPTHTYNVVIGLDREGEDYVDYGLASVKLRETLKNVGFTRGIGSWSDICVMGHVGCNKINVGLGTFKSHSVKSGFDLDVYHRQISRVVAFAKDYRGHVWPEAEGNEYGHWGFGGGRKWAETEDPIRGCVTCASCGEKETLDDIRWSNEVGGFMCVLCQLVSRVECVWGNK